MIAIILGKHGRFLKHRLYVNVSRSFDSLFLHSWLGMISIGLLGIEILVGVVVGIRIAILVLETTKV